MKSYLYLIETNQCYPGLFLVLGKCWLRPLDCHSANLIERAITSQRRRHAIALEMDDCLFFYQNNDVLIYFFLKMS
jgi:hypothetical protein